MNPTISVVVCTYNRVEILNKCLESLVNQIISKEFYEVIIIDNCSTDHTFELCQEFIRKNNNIRYFFEMKLGLPHARNRGWYEAKGEYVAYIDDDAKAYPDWLKEMVVFINKFPEVSIFGGPYDGYSLVEIPKWFPNNFGQHSLGDIDRPVEIGKEWIHGSNMVFRKSVLALQGGFLTTLGMKGKKLSYGDEIRALLDLNDLGNEIYYASKMKVKHLIQAEKISLWWILKDSYFHGSSMSKTFKINQTFLTCVKGIIKNILLFFKIFFSVDSMPFKRRVYASLCGLFKSLGVLVAYMKDNNIKFSLQK